MKHDRKSAWSGVDAPVNSQPVREQVAALCYRKGEKGPEVLLITSRDTGRWIVPKGWPITGKDGRGSALQEAWEEAGVAKADMSDEPLGSFDYRKRLDDGSRIPIRATVYMAHVRKLKDHYPEVDERTRKWFTPKKAARLVNEPELAKLLRDFDG